MTRALVALLCLAWAQPALADDTLWNRAAADKPAAKRKKGQPPAGLSPSEQAMWRGQYYTRVLARMRRTFSPKRRLELVWTTARNAYEKAIALDPDNAEAHLHLAELVASVYIPRNGVARLELDDSWRTKAIYHWEQFERLAPDDPRLVEVRKTRSLEYTRLNSDDGLRKALVDYAALINSDLATMRAVEAGRITSNRAEIHMMLGQMPDAITWYKRALEFRADADWAFGLAVAYDRDGQGMRAREILERYVTERSVKAMVHQLSVTGELFFVPEAEVYYYYGLLHEHLGNYDLAIQAFQRFVRSGAHKAFHSRARDNIRRLRRTVRTHGATRHSPRHWSRNWHTQHQPSFVPEP